MRKCRAICEFFSHLVFDPKLNFNKNISHNYAFGKKSVFNEISGSEMWKLMTVSENPSPGKSKKTRSEKANTEIVKNKLWKNIVFLWKYLVLRCENLWKVKVPFPEERRTTKTKGKEI